MDAAQLERWVRSMATGATRRSALRGTAALAAGGARPRRIPTLQAAEARRRRRRVHPPRAGESGTAAQTLLSRTTASRRPSRPKCRGAIQVDFNVAREGGSGDFLVSIGAVDTDGVPVADAPPLAETRVSDETSPRVRPGVGHGQVLEPGRRDEGNEVRPDLYAGFKLRRTHNSGNRCSETSTAWRLGRETSANQRTAELCRSRPGFAKRSGHPGWRISEDAPAARRHARRMAQVGGTGARPWPEMTTGHRTSRLSGRIPIFGDTDAGRPRR